MTELVSVTIDPNWCGIYLDGALYRARDRYMEPQLIADAINEFDIESAERRDASFDTWEGSPQTLNELTEMYDADW